MASLATSLPANGAIERRRAARPSLRVVAAVADASGAPADRERSPNWVALGLIAAAHVAAIAALLSSGAIRIGAAVPPPVAVAFVAEVPEPAVVAAAPEAALEPVPTEIFVPEVRIETPPPAMPPVTSVALPLAAAAIAAPPAADGAGDPMVVPPDFAADQLDNPGPRYPSASRRAHEEGTVTLKVLVSADGRAQALDIATSSGFARLDAAALATVKRWAFLPAKRAGVAVAAWVLVPVTFALDVPR